MFCLFIYCEKRKNIKSFVECKVPNSKSPTGKNKIHNTWKNCGLDHKRVSKLKNNNNNNHILAVLNLLLSNYKVYTSYKLNLLQSN